MAESLDEAESMRGMIEVLAVEFLELQKVVRPQRFAHAVFFPEPFAQIDRLAPFRTKRPQRFSEKLGLLAAGGALNFLFLFHRRSEPTRCDLKNLQNISLPLHGLVPIPRAGITGHEIIPSH